MFKHCFVFVLSVLISYLSNLHQVVSLCDLVAAAGACAPNSYMVEFFSIEPTVLNLSVTAMYFICGLLFAMLADMCWLLIEIPSALGF